MTFKVLICCGVTSLYDVFFINVAVSSNNSQIQHIKLHANMLESSEFS